MPGKDGRRAGDLPDRDFTAHAPNRVWVADFTYVRTEAGFVYVAFVVDVPAQVIVGWHALAHKQTGLLRLSGRRWELRLSGFLATQRRLAIPESGNPPSAGDQERAGPPPIPRCST